jgi:pimeloyl-ACP methyl ester carboxylesterase
LQATEGGTWTEGGFDPAPIYASLKCPLLFIWGDKDTVVPLEDSHRRIEAALTETHHPDFQIVRLPNTTHKMYQDPHPAEGLQPSEIETRLHRTRFTSDFREQMATWAKQHLP